MLFVGNYFLFHNASDIQPVAVQFKDHEAKLKTYSAPSLWREKIYLNPSILQRKWMEYKVKDRFIPSVAYDNVLPLEINYDLYNKVGEEEQLRLCSHDKSYRNVYIEVCTIQGETVLHEELGSLLPGTEKTVSFALDTPGVYTIYVSTPERRLKKTALLYYRKRTLLFSDDKSSNSFREFESLLHHKGNGVHIFCTTCKSCCFPATPYSSPRFLHKNYIPIKAYIDVEHLGKERINHFVMGMDHPLSFKRGLIHLLNMLRLASIEDEITIVTNLFKDDAAFAYFITDRLFLFSMIPLMNDRELQNILNRVDDHLLASALHGQNKELNEKILGNISKRRSSLVQQEMGRVPKSYSGDTARRDMHRFIKSYFEKRYGRGLKIPYGTGIRYKKDDMDSYTADDGFGTIFNHQGTLVFHTGYDIYEIATPTTSHNSRVPSPIRCMNYDVESYLSDVFSVHGISESSVYLSSNAALSSALIHIYNWNDSLEDTERIDNLGKNTILPISASSYAVVLTIGAIDARGKMSEQVIRIQKRDS
jgi:hypothetical protein